MFTHWLFATVLLVAISINTAPSAAAQPQGNFSHDPYFLARVDKLAAQYDQRWQAAQSQAALRPQHDQCEDDLNGPTCLDTVCNLIGKFNCDEASEIQRVGESCRGNRGGECVNKACSYVGHFNCDDPSEVLLMAKSCRGVWRPTCVDEICSRLSRFECDELNEIRAVLNSCT